MEFISERGRDRSKTFLFLNYVFLYFWGDWKFGNFAQWQRPYACTDSQGVQMGYHYPHVDEGPLAFLLFEPVIDAVGCLVPEHCSKRQLEIDSLASSDVDSLTRVFPTAQIKCAHCSGEV
eukprot:1617922-Amphidinium_carterae.1